MGDFEPWEVQTFTGTGNQVVRLVPLVGQFLLIFQTGPSDDYIGVTGVNGRGEQTMYAVNSVGQYSGTTMWLIEEDPVVAFQVQCPVGWSLAIRPVSDARVWQGSDVTGTGDDVLVLDPPASGFMTVAMHATSEGNTFVSGYSQSHSHLLFNEVGSFQQEAVLPAGVWIMTVHTDAPWSMARG